ncbi:hypothetical protein PLESTB_000427900 [Pleodorina starrii]|uniref:C-CAP/cofactor C-like domain-containing protein n=1 Tax=Pleodorina starrii TaxID=330485 RepID=A0A9W6BFV8_9CHLO|nr:hypothetical protein PLESTM_001696000 [Pleodorina starrii]GLC50751.1 hypothetical protein PLESTB_000427900 [Pleodorina starrii]
MGCVNGKEKRARQYALSGNDEVDTHHEDTAADGKAQSASPPAAKKGKTAAASGNVVNIPRPNLDPKDFQFVGGQNEVKIKPPGSINGQSFMIDKCENCDIYILDHTGQVTMDDCKNCRVYIGPTDGSVFIRDCTSCNLAVVCRQLRTRDCNGCQVALYCRTKPIVESSSNMSFSCLDLPYPELGDHMRHAKLGIFHNFWYDIFDFTPKDGNWRLIPSSSSSSAALLEPIPHQAAELLRPLGQQQQGEGGGEGGVSEQSPLLLTHGQRSPQSEGMSYMFVAFDGGQHARALQLARSAAAKGWLLRTNEARLGAAAAGSLAAEAGWSKSVAKALSSGTAGCVGLELAVPEAEAQGVRAQVSQLGGHVSGSEAAGKSFRTAGLEG